ncbi:NAB3 [Candida theae]|uniref:NAB3 n=1 Tax=Candida theae TaxID=1198502 RepID=A0AAD5FZ30_9ASCO|nr:NAB3 [Candida theae]KAI5959224.1 NAB3 [Candida theae]
MEVNPVSLKRHTSTGDSDEEYEPTNGPSLSAHNGDIAKFEEGQLFNPSQMHQEESNMDEFQSDFPASDKSDMSANGSEFDTHASSREKQNEPDSAPQLEVDVAQGSNLEHESFIPEELANHEDDTEQSKPKASESNDDAYDPDQSNPSEDSTVHKPVEDPEHSEPYKPEAQVKNEDEDEDEDDYDPEANQKSAAHLPAPSLPSKPPIGLPPKPPQSAKSNPSTSPISTQGEMAETLRNAYNTYVHSELANDAAFSQQPQEVQVESIKALLRERGIDLGEINYDQVYSYNKPHKHLKDPIPLVPVSEFCRRPNITEPSTQEEEKEYEEFIKRENYYMDLQNWDEFPDKSRLFVGNLPANTISKQDLYRIFRQYGEVIQIAIKAGYGFVQFRDTEACLACVKGETDVPLHNKVLRLDASKPQKSRRSGNPDVNNPNLGSRGRERPAEDEPAPKRRRGNIDCIVYITGKSSVFFIRQVKKAFANSQVQIDTEDVTQRNITEVLSEAAYSGFLGACVVKENKVDVQTYEAQPNGGIKFDEYADIEPEEAAEVMAKAKITKYGGNTPSYYAPDAPSHHDNAQEKGNRRYDHDRNRGRNNRRGRGRHGNQGNFSNDHYGRHKNNFSHQPWPNADQFQQFSSAPQQQVYGQVPQSQFPSFNNSQFASPYQAPPQQPHSYNQFTSPQMNSNQPNISHALQSLDANQVQSMINLLQQQQQQQQQQSPGPGMPPQPYSMQSQHPTAPPPMAAPAPAPAPAAYGQPPPLNYGDRGRRREPNYAARNRPYGNVPQPHQNTSSGFNPGPPNSGPSALLSRLQSGSYNQAGNTQQSGSNSALMETLQKLARR